MPFNYLLIASPFAEEFREEVKKKPFNYLLIASKWICYCWSSCYSFQLSFDCFLNSILLAVVGLSKALSIIFWLLRLGDNRDTGDPDTPVLSIIFWLLPIDSPPPPLFLTTHYFQLSFDCFGIPPSGKVARVTVKPFNYLLIASRGCRGCLHVPQTSWHFQLSFDCFAPFNECRINTHPHNHAFNYLLIASWCTEGGQYWWFEELAVLLPVPFNYLLIASCL